jgi:hypothetical protein
MAIHPESITAEVERLRCYLVMGEAANDFGTTSDLKMILRGYDRMKEAITDIIQPGCMCRECLLGQDALGFLEKPNGEITD